MFLVYQGDADHQNPTLGVFLAEFRAKIRYIQGARNVRADLMSRLPPPLSVAVIDTAEWVDPDAVNMGGVLDRLPLEADQLDREQVRKAQHEEFGSLFIEAQGEDSDYEVHDGLLYSIKRPTATSAWYPRLVLPKAFRDQVIERSHKEVGHMATMKTLNRVREAYVWPGMRQSIADCLKQCPRCVTNQQRTERPPMSDMPLPAYCMQVVGVDLIGPFVPSEQGNRYAVVIVDHLSGWAEALPIPNKSSMVVEQALAWEFISRHGAPEVMITDRGLEFSSGHFRKYLEGLGVEHRQSTPYHPETNGKVERLNRTLKGIITKLVNNDARAWEDQLANTLCAYRNSVNASTGFTPFYLMHGRRGRLPLTRCLGASPGTDSLGGRLSDLSEALMAARENLADSRKYNRERLNDRANAGPLKPGDTVVLKAQEKMTFTSGWDPQYEVNRTRGPVCWIRQQQTGKTHTVNRSKLLLVDPNIVWDELRPRPRRNARRLGGLPAVVTGPLGSMATDDAAPGPSGSKANADAAPGPSRSMATDDAAPGPSGSTATDDTAPGPSGSAATTGAAQSVASDESDEEMELPAPSPRRAETAGPTTVGGNEVDPNETPVIRVPRFPHRYGTRLNTGRSTLPETDQAVPDPVASRSRHEHVHHAPYSLADRPSRSMRAVTLGDDQSRDPMVSQPDQPVPVSHGYFTRSRGPATQSVSEDQRSHTATKRPATDPVSECVPSLGEQKRQRLVAVELASIFCS